MAFSSIAVAELFPHFSSSSVHHRKTPFLSKHSQYTFLSFSSPSPCSQTYILSKRNARLSSDVPRAGVQHLTGSLTRNDGLRFAVVVSRFNEIVTKLLLEGALETFKRYSVREEDIHVVWVPGSFEIPVVAQKLGKAGKYHAILCIGAVV